MRAQGGHEEAREQAVRCVLGAAYTAPPQADRALEGMVGRASQQLAWKAGAAWREWELKSRAARAWVEGREKQLGWLQRVFAAWVAGRRWEKGERWGSGQGRQIGLSGEWTQVRYALIRRAGGARRREERERAADRAEQAGDAQARQAW